MVIDTFESKEEAVVPEGKKEDASIEKESSQNSSHEPESVPMSAIELEIQRVIQTLCRMGFEEDVAVGIVAVTGADVSAALEYLLQE